MLNRLFAQSSDGPAVLKVEPWIVDSTTPYDGAKAAYQVVEESRACLDCASPHGCQKHVQAYIEALRIGGNNR